MKEGAIRVLCVDDEPQMLDWLLRSLKSEFHVQTAVSVEQALHTLVAEGPFDVIVCDLSMPGMDGPDFLTLARARAPDATPLLLTGQVDLESAIRVFNGGGVFRFLTKPPVRPQLVTAIREAAEVGRLRQAERILLEQTLNGTVKALSNLLSLSCPILHGRSTRVRERVAALAKTVGAPDSWQAETAATVAMIGVMAVPDDAVRRWLAGAPRPQDMPLIASIPQLSANAIRDVPRLGPVAEIVRSAHDSPTDPDVPWGARALRICQDFQDAMGRRQEPATVLDKMQRYPHVYDAELVEVFTAQINAANAGPVAREVLVESLGVGMILAQHLVISKGEVILLAQGAVLTSGLIERVQNVHRRTEIREPIYVFMP